MVFSASIFFPGRWWIGKAPLGPGHAPRCVCARGAHAAPFPIWRRIGRAPGQASADLLQPEGAGLATAPARHQRASQLRHQSSQVAATAIRATSRRAGHAAENLGTLRRLALNLLQREKTKKRGLKGKQKNAGWDHAYLLRFLGI